MKRNRLFRRLPDHIARATIAATILAALTACMTSRVMHPSRSQAESFIRALAAHRFTAAENLVVPSQRGRFSASYLQTRWEQMEQVTGKPSTIVLDEVELSVKVSIGNGSTGSNGQGKAVRYTYVLEGATQREAEVIITLRQQQGKWLVDQVILAF